MVGLFWFNNVWICGVVYKIVLLDDIVIKWCLVVFRVIWVFCIEWVFFR